MFHAFHRQVIIIIFCGVGAGWADVLRLATLAVERRRLNPSPVLLRCRQACTGYNLPVFGLKQLIDGHSWRSVAMWTECCVFCAPP
jgi:hypothetical protein